MISIADFVIGMMVALGVTSAFTLIGLALAAITSRMFGGFDG